jgi:hypothetical protein
MDKFKKIQIPTHLDDRGALSVLELKDFISWEPKRVYYVTGVAKPRGGHCVKGEKKIYIVMQGSCRAKIFDGYNWFELDLKGPDQALVFDADLWREFDNFTPGTVLAVVSNINYDKSLYITDILDYEKYIKEQL